MVRGYWWCDACKASFLPPRSPSLREIFKEAGESLRRFFSPSSGRRTVLTYPRSIPPAEPGAALARCPACGALSPREFSSCVRCGTMFGPPTELSRLISVRARELPDRDETVYRYIVENRGEISLSKASVDLHITIPELQASIARLESSRKIMRDSSGSSAPATG